MFQISVFISDCKNISEIETFAKLDNHEFSFHPFTGFLLKVVLDVGKEKDIKIVYSLTYVWKTFSDPLFGSMLNACKQSKNNQYHDYNSKFNHEILTPRVKEVTILCAEGFLHEIGFIGKRINNNEHFYRKL